MKTLVFAIKINGRDKIKFISGQTDIHLDLYDDSVKANTITEINHHGRQIDAWDVSGNYIGHCIDIIENDPDADTYGMTSEEMLQEIRSLRFKLRQK